MKSFTEEFARLVRIQFGYAVFLCNKVIFRLMLATAQDILGHRDNFSWSAFD